MSSPEGGIKTHSKLERTPLGGELGGGEVFRIKTHSVKTDAPAVWGVGCWDQNTLKVKKDAPGGGGGGGERSCWGQNTLKVKKDVTGGGGGGGTTAVCVCVVVFSFCFYCCCKMSEIFCLCFVFQATIGQ